METNSIWIAVIKKKKKPCCVILDCKMAGKFDFFQICLPEGIEQERKKSSVLAGESNRGRVLLSLFNYVTTTRITWSTWPSADCCSLVKSNNNLTSEKVQIQSWQTVLNGKHRPCRPCRVEGGGFVEKLPAKNPQPSQKNREDSWRTSERPSSSSSSVGTSRGILAPKTRKVSVKNQFFMKPKHAEDSCYARPCSKREAPSRFIQRANSR